MENNKDYTFTDENGNEVHIENEQNNEDCVNIGADGIHIKDSKGVRVDIDKDGIKVNGKKKTHKKSAGKTFPFFALATLIYVVLVLICAVGAFDFGEKNVYLWGLLVFLIVPVADSVRDSIIQKRYTEGMSFVTCLVAFFIVGLVFNAWHPGWMLLLLSPLAGSIAKAVKTRDAANFAMWDLALIVFLIFGFAPKFGISEFPLWHPAWVVFLLIPVYYSFVAYIKKR